jgi:4-diphosphocytidyl-2-C-methyl-D-erythritol kinase
MIPLALEAPAKLNLSLRVVGRRADGYHLLETEMVLLELADRLLLMPGAAGLRVEAPGSEIRVDRSNLAWRGLLAGLGAEPDLLCLTLEKRIPVGAGLGGGSSDAAAAWRLGRRAAGASEAASVDDLVGLAGLGADVPFFAAACAAATVAGIGEQIRPTPVPNAAFVVLVHPAFGLSTAAVFAELREDDLGHHQPGGNDLLAPASRLRPELLDLMKIVEGAGAVPRLSGSGSTIFAQTDDPERAAALGAELRRFGLRVTETRLREAPASIVELDDPPSEGGVPPPSMG